MMIFIADVFPLFRTPKNIVRQKFKKWLFRVPFDKEDGKGGQTLLKTERHSFYHTYWSQWKQLRCKKSPLVICKVLKTFINMQTD